MKLLVKREPTAFGATLGRLYIDGVMQCDTLEDEIREIPGQPVTKWKVYGYTAIPQGLYKLTAENSPRFGPDTLTVNAVPGFEGIRVHAGNSEKDTHGCLLVGTRAGRALVSNSRSALAALKAKLLPVLARGEAVTIEYRNP
jgi:hypothetical protein